MKHWPRLLAFWAFPARGRDLRTHGSPGRPSKMQSGTLRAELEAHHLQKALSAPLADELPSQPLSPATIILVVLTPPPRLLGPGGLSLQYWNS